MEKCPVYNNYQLVLESSWFTILPLNEYGNVEQIGIQKQFKVGKAK